MSISSPQDHPKIKSIRRYMLIGVSLILLFALVAHLCITYIEVEKQGDKRLKIELFHAARTISALISPPVSNKALHSSRFNPREFLTDYKIIIKNFIKDTPIQDHKVFGPFHLPSFAYQLWETHPLHLLLKSPQASSQPMATSLALNYHHYIDHSGRQWQTIVYPGPMKNTLIIVASPEKVARSIELSRFRGHLTILFVLYLIFALLLLYIIQAALKPLQKLKNDIKNRDPASLTPIPVKPLPVELNPAVTALNRLFERVQEMLTREKRFTADAAHELRTPLATLKTLAEIIQRENDETIRAELLGKLTKSVDRISHLIDQLLMLNKVSSFDGEVPNAEAITLQAVCQLAVEQFQDFIQTNQAIVEINAPKTPLQFRGNQALLISLLTNLIKNAILYSGEHAKVTIKLTESDQKLIIKVIDHGPGVENDDALKRIFDRFYREPGTKKMGSGLGLSIATNIVLLHKGHIEARHTENKPSSGLTVVIRLPKAKQ